MKRIVLVCAFALVVVPQAFGATWVKSIAAAQKKAKEKNQLIFVDMYAAWCGWCHRLEQEVFPSEAFQKVTDDKVLLKIDTEDGGEGTKLARQLQVGSLPTSVLMTSDLMIAGIVRGYAPPAAFAKSLQDAQTQYETFLGKLKDESKYATDYQKRLDIARELTQRNGVIQSEARLKKLITEKGVPSAIRDQAYYELAVSQILQLKYDDTLKTLTAFSKLQSKGEPFERSRLLLGQLYMDQGNFLGAANEFRAFKTKFPNSPLVRNVDMMLPDIERRLRK